MSRPRKDTSSADTSSKIRNYVLEQIDDEGKAKLQKVIDHYLQHANVGAIGGGLNALHLSDQSWRKDRGFMFLRKNQRGLDKLRVMVNRCNPSRILGQTQLARR